MGTDVLLISMARYMHAVYDIEIAVDTPNFKTRIKKHVERFRKKDTTLQSYWDEYISKLTGRETKAKLAKTKEKSQQTQLTYRGHTIQTIKNSSTNNSKSNKGAEKKTNPRYYRGQLISDN